MSNSSVLGWVPPKVFVIWKHVVSHDYSWEAVKIQLQHTHGKSLTFPSSQGVCDLKWGCWGLLLWQRFKKRLSLRWAQQEGRHELLPAVASGNPVGAQPSGALLASNFEKLWESGGTSWESRGPGKRKKSSFPPFAAGNHEHLVTATW